MSDKMNTTITTTPRKAAIIARQELASICGVKRLTGAQLNQSFAVVNCVCGESGAIRLYSCRYQKEAVVGYCNCCGQK